MSYGTKVNQEELLKAIQANPDPFRRTELAQQFGVSSERIRQLWKKFYRKGLVTKPEGIGLGRGRRTGGVVRIIRQAKPNTQRTTSPVQAPKTSNPMNIIDDPIKTLNLLAEAIHARLELPVCKAAMEKAIKERDQAMDLAKGKDEELKEYKTTFLKYKLAIQQGGIRS